MKQPFTRQVIMGLLVAATALIVPETWMAAPQFFLGMILFVAGIYKWETPSAAVRMRTSAAPPPAVRRSL